MTITDMNLDDALQMSALVQKGYAYVWYQEISRAGICKTQDYVPDVSHLMEARVFKIAATNGDAEEIHIFGAQDGTLKAIHIKTQETDPHRDETNILIRSYGKSLTVRTVYDYEQDGQAYPAVSLLVGYEGMGA